MNAPTTEPGPDGEVEVNDGNRTRGKRLKGLLANLLLVMMSISVALIFAEIAVRIVAPQQLIMIRPDVWQPADTVGWLHRPDVATEMNTGERTISLYTDADGFRVGAAGPVQGSREVLLLGDSFMEALQVDYEDSGAGLLEERLGRELGETVAIRNAGIGGWDPDQYLLRARSLIPESRYDAVVVAVYLGNDVIPSAREYVPPREPVRRYRFRIPRGLSRAELTNALARPLNDFLEVRSHLFLFFKNRLQSVRMRAGLAVLDFPPTFLRENDQVIPWDVTSGLLADIEELAEAHDVPSLFVLIPAPFQIDPDDLARYVQGYGIDPAGVDLEQPNRHLLEAMRTQGLNVMDLLPAFRDAHEGGTRLYGSVDQHFTIEGNRLFADLVGPRVLELLAQDRNQAMDAGEGD
jgi:hypothetical protein